MDVVIYNALSEFFGERYYSLDLFIDIIRYFLDFKVNEIILTIHMHTHLKS